MELVDDGRDKIDEVEKVIEDQFNDLSEKIDDITPGKEMFSRVCICGKERCACPEGQCKCEEE